MILLRNRCQRTTKTKMTVHRKLPVVRFWLMVASVAARNAQFGNHLDTDRASCFNRNGFYFYSIKPVIIQVASHLALLSCTCGFTGQVSPFTRNMQPLAFAEDRSSHKMILLLLSGIEPNPGPPTTPYPCGICHRECQWSQHAFACDTCNQWIHRKCTGYTVFEYYQLAAKSDEPWICPRCTQRQKEEFSRLSAACKRKQEMFSRLRPRTRTSRSKNRPCRQFSRNSGPSAAPNNTDYTKSNSSSSSSTKANSSSTTNSSSATKSAFSDEQELDGAASNPGSLSINYGRTKIPCCQGTYFNFKVFFIIFVSVLLLEIIMLIFFFKLVMYLCSILN